MNILMLTTSYPRNNADMSGIFIKRLAVSMACTGAKILILAPGDEKSKLEQIENGIRVVRFSYAPKFLMKLGYGAGGIPENLKNKPILYLLIPFFIIAFMINTVRLSKSCDIIHSNWFYTALCALPAGKLRNKPIVVTLRGSDFKKEKSKLFIWAVKFLNGITTVNNSWAEYLKKIINCKVIYIPNGVKIIPQKNLIENRLNNSKVNIRIVYVGALSVTKGADLLGQIAKKVFKKNPQIQFIIVGPGNSEKFSLNKIPNITLLGSIPPDEIFQVYALSDIFILPSRHEGRPNSLLEAMASGLPCIATDLPGVTEVLTEKCGIIVDNGSVPKMVDAIFKLSENSTERIQMGKNAKKRINELSLDWHSCALNYLKFFKEVILCAE